MEKVVLRFFVIVSNKLFLLDLRVSLWAPFCFFFYNIVLPCLYTILKIFRQTCCHPTTDRDCALCIKYS